MNVCKYCGDEIIPGMPYVVFEYSKYHLSCFAKYEIEYRNRGLKE